MVGGFCSTVDHLVNNAGVTQIELFEDFIQISDSASIMVKIKTNMVAFLSHFCNKTAILIALEFPTPPPKNKKYLLNRKKKIK